jgi:hypothetical protein
VLSRYATDRICDALPIVPFALRNERVERFENLLFAESRHEVFQIVLNISSHRRSKVGINIEFSRAPAALREFHAPWRT